MNYRDTLWAVCGINCFHKTRGTSDWTHCHHCREPLYYDTHAEAEQHRRECRRPQLEPLLPRLKAPESEAEEYERPRLEPPRRRAADPDVWSKL